jgi:cell division protease FtsH
MNARVLAFAALLVTAHAAAQQQVYKWVDPNGHVTYSETPPPGAVSPEPIDLLPPPAPTDVEAAQQRAQAMQELSDQLTRAREEREAEVEQERRGAREEMARQQAYELPPDMGDGGDYGWWVPGGPSYPPGYLPPRQGPFWPRRPVPPPNRNPSAAPDHPAYWPWPPFPPPDVRPVQRGRLNPLPPRPAGSP